VSKTSGVYDMKLIYVLVCIPVAWHAVLLCAAVIHNA